MYPGVGGAILPLCRQCVCGREKERRLKGLCLLFWAPDSTGLTAMQVMRTALTRAGASLRIR